MSVTRSLALVLVLVLALAVPADGPLAPPAAAQEGPWLEHRGENELVLIHGLGANAGIWRMVKPYLAGSFRVFVYELHGHGRTAALADATITSEVEAFGRWLAEQDLLHPNLVGHGLGGMIAMQYALTHQHHVRSLVVIDAGPRQLLDDEQKAAVARHLYGDYDRFVASRFVAISDRQDVNEEAVDMALRTDSTTFVSLLLSSFDWDVTGLLPRQTVPLLVIGSESFLPEAGAEQDYLVAYGYGGARLLNYRRVPDTGHYLMLENPTSLAANLLIWLRGRD